MWTRLGPWAWVVFGLGALLPACGGGGDDPAVTPGVATVGVAGGTVQAADGAQVVFPKDALRADTTVRIAMDSTGAPPLPPAAVAAGAVYAITPHGATFDEHAQVSIPVGRTETAANEQLLLVTAEPGDTQWRVLSGAIYANGAMHAPVMHFSFFQVIVLTNLSMPSLVTTIDSSQYIGEFVGNNVGGPGVGRFAAGFEFNQTSWMQYEAVRLQASLILSRVQ